MPGCRRRSRARRRVSDTWQWQYEPDEQHVAGGLPGHVVAAVERLAGELVQLAEVGVDITDIGEGPRRGHPGGVRRLPLPRLRLIAVTRIIPPFADL